MIEHDLNMFSFIESLHKIKATLTVLVGKDLENLELFLINSNLSNDEREKLIDIIDSMKLSNVKLFLKENGI